MEHVIFDTLPYICGFCFIFCCLNALLK